MQKTGPWLTWLKKDNVLRHTVLPSTPHCFVTVNDGIYCSCSAVQDQWPQRTQHRGGVGLGVCVGRIWEGDNDSLQNNKSESH